MKNSTHTKYIHTKFHKNCSVFKIIFSYVHIFKDLKTKYYTFFFLYLRTFNTCTKFSFTKKKKKMLIKMFMYWSYFKANICCLMHFEHVTRVKLCDVN